MNSPAILQETDKSISTIIFNSDDIARLIQNLYPDKYHGHGLISIHMLKLCSKSISTLPNIMFQSGIKHGEFPTEWKKAKVVSIH